MAGGSGDEGAALPSYRVANITYSINATLRVVGVPLPATAEGMGRLRASFATAGYAATGAVGLRVADLSAEAGGTGALVVALQWELAASLTSAALPLNHSVPASDDADLEDVAFFARAGAVASVERLRGLRVSRARSQSCRASIAPARPQRSSRQTFARAGAPRRPETLLCLRAA